jgi:transcriptional regulator with XRE-family HTH domain
MADYLGISQRHLSKIERGKGAPTIENASSLREVSQEHRLDIERRRDLARSASFAIGRLPRCSTIERFRQNNIALPELE